MRTSNVVLMAVTYFYRIFRVGGADKKLDILRAQKERNKYVFTRQIDIALKVYHQCESVSKTVRVLGYPTRRALYKWIEKEGSIKPLREPLIHVNTGEHPRNPPFEVKMDAIHRCFELGEGIKSVSEDIGYTRASIYNWRKRYLKGSTTALLNGKNIKPDTLTEGMASSTPEIEHMQAQMNDMQLEIDILKETINVLKKDPGIDQRALKNSERQ